MGKRERENTVPEADKAMKSPRLDRQTVGGKSLASMGLLHLQVQAAAPSPSDSSATSISDRDGNIKPCHHMCLDSESVDMAVYDIEESEELPTCHYPGCRVTWKGAGESKEGMMKCMECHYIACAGWPVDRDDPQRHALWHAEDTEHHVAQWYDEPKLGYCFECARVMRLTDDQDELSDDEFSNVDRKVDDDRGMVASKTIKQQGMVASKTIKQQGMVASNTIDQQRMVAGSSKVDSATVASDYKANWETVTSYAIDRMVAGDHASGNVTGNGYVIRGMPNHGNTCYMNASLQCLLALGKLRTTILGLDARLGDIGLKLKQLFVETSSVNNGRHMLDPNRIVKHMQELYPERFEVGKMGDSHEFLTSLRNALDSEVMELNESELKKGIDVFPTFGHSIFRGQQIRTVSCKSCSHNFVEHIDFKELILPLPQKVPPAPARSVAAPPRNKSHRSPAKICKKLFQQTDKSDGGKTKTIAECANSQILGLEFGDGAMERTPKPLKVDSSGVKDVVQSCLQMKDDAPLEIMEVPMKLDFIPNLFDDDTEEMEEPTADPRNSEDKEKAQSSDIVHDEPEHMKSLASIDSCLTLFLHQSIDCNKCSKVAEVPETNESKAVEPIMASTNVNATVDGDQTELSDRKTCPNERSSDFSSLSVESPSKQPYPSGSLHQAILSEDITTEDITSGTSSGEKDLASCSTANEKAETHEGAGLSCLPTDKQTDLLSAQDIQDTSTQKQASGKQVICDHSAEQVAEKQNKQTDGNGDAIQTQLISNLPAVLTIQLGRFKEDRSKLKGHVSFMEILHLEPFMDPSSEDKDKSSYRLVGVIEHLGDTPNTGHYVAYVRGSGSSSWVCAGDLIVMEVSLEQVLRCEAYILFYERIEGN